MAIRGVIPGGVGVIGESTDPRDGNGDRVRTTDGSMELLFERVGRRTVLRRNVSTAPLRVPPPVDLDGCAYVTLLNVSGGIVGGDRLRHDLTVRAGAHALATTQSATKVYRCAGVEARSDVRVVVETGGVLEWIPDPVIPFAGARFAQSLVVELAPGAVAIVSDVWAAGRIARGERWAFARIANHLLVTLNGRPSVQEGFVIAAQAAAALEHWPYLASWYVVGGGTTDWCGLAESISTRLAECEPEVYGGASTLDHGVAVRFVASSSDTVSRASTRVWDQIRRQTLGLAVPLLRKA
ncbi:MAG TPA: urease accessory protein UreD [Nitrospiria bacterium]|nr:urease accessory protein UreD [Nitrospiria bacterium]